MGLEMLGSGSGSRFLGNEILNKLVSFVMCSTARIFRGMNLVGERFSSVGLRR